MEEQKPTKTLEFSNYDENVLENEMEERNVNLKITNSTISKNQSNTLAQNKIIELISLKISQVHTSEKIRSHKCVLILHNLLITEGEVIKYLMQIATIITKYPNDPLVKKIIRIAKKLKDIS